MEGCRQKCRWVIAGRCAYGGLQELAPALALLDKRVSGQERQVGSRDRHSGQ